MQEMALSVIMNSSVFPKGGFEMFEVLIASSLMG